MQNGAGTVESSLVAPQEAKHRVIIGLGNSTPGYMPRRTENICSNKNLYTNVQRSNIHKSQKEDTIKMYIN